MARRRHRHNPTKPCRGVHRSGGHRTSLCPCPSEIWSDNTCSTELLPNLSVGLGHVHERTVNNKKTTRFTQPPIYPTPARQPAAPSPLPHATSSPVPPLSAKVFDKPPSPSLVDNANEGFDAEKTNGFHHRSLAITLQVERGIEGLFSSMEVNTRSVLPPTDRLQLKFRWGIRFPDELGDVFSNASQQKFLSARISFHKIPLLIINKVSIEHMVPAKTKKSAAAGDDQADACRSIQKQLEFLGEENGMLKEGDGEDPVGHVEATGGRLELGGREAGCG